MLNYLRIKQIRKYPTEDGTETVVLSLVISHLDYCNGIPYGMSEVQLKQMQRIQNICAKLVSKLIRFHSSKQSLYKLH